MGLIGFICNKCHKYVNVEKYGGVPYCPYCDITQEKRTNTNGTTYFEPAVGAKVSTKEIDAIAKKNGWVYGGEDLSREAARNKAYQKEKFANEFRNNLAKEIREAI